MPVRTHTALAFWVTAPPKTSALRSLDDLICRLIALEPVESISS